MNQQPKKIKPEAEIYTVYSERLEQLNATFIKGFFAHHQNQEVVRTHLFNDRYENIYLNEKHIAELSQFKQEACNFAKLILSTDHIDMAYWFNSMDSGAVTTAHRHDDDDELLSAVYYICVPENSGDIIFKGTGEDMRITPKEGQFLFFKPDMVHEVSENLSQENRLSIGINFGHRNSQD